MRTSLAWAVIGVGVAVPILAAAASPQLAWRDPVYILAGFAGVIGLALLLVQPSLIAGVLSGLNRSRERRAHRWVGVALVVAVLVHVVGLWLTSPPDVIDALIFASPTPFSVWGVIAMWAVFAAALLASQRRRLRPRTWRLFHLGLAVVVVVGTVVHALLIEGTMEPISKAMLCGLVILATGKIVVDFFSVGGRR